MSRIRRAKSVLDEVGGMYDTTETAERLGVTVQNLGKVRDLPEEYQRRSRGRLWIADEIDLFAEEREAEREKKQAAAA